MSFEFPVVFRDKVEPDLAADIIWKAGEVSEVAVSGDLHDGTDNEIEINERFCKEMGEQDRPGENGSAK